MAKGTFPVSVKILLGLCLIIFGTVSCTYDYFRDENNFQLYVPQIQDGEISRFYVAFHDADGNHIRTRQIEAPFDKDELMIQGILRFKLYPGEYHISCFADYMPGSITEGGFFADSYKAYEKDMDCGEDDVFKSRKTNPRALFFKATSYPLGHPDGKMAVEANLDESTRFKGQVTVNFIDLPASIARVDIAYAGLSTKFKFGGALNSFTPGDRIAVSTGTADLTPLSSTILSYTEIINPSMGIDFMDYLASGTITGARSMELEVNFYNAGGVLMGTTHVSEADIPGLDTDKRPTDGDGNPVSSLILAPQHRIIFTFKGFTIFQVELKGWGDIVPGETTPM